jgi:hypothetical protein
MAKAALSQVWGETCTQPSSKGIAAPPEGKKAAHEICKKVRNCLECHGQPLKWTDSAVMTMLSAYISHGQESGY